MEAAQLVILHVESNDLDSLPAQHRQPIGMDIFMFAKQLISQGVRHVVISQVVRRASWRRARAEDGTNEFLDATCSGPEPISFWKHNGLWNVQITIRGDLEKCENVNFLLARLHSECLTNETNTSHIIWHR